MSEITDTDDLEGMLPDEIVAEVRRLTAECEARGRELEVARECHIEQRALAEARGAEVAELLAAGDDLAGLLLMALDDQIRCGWVTEGSPLLDEPRRALERWHALVLEGVGGAEPMSVDERDREVLEEARRIYGLSPAANDWLAKAREGLERAARFADTALLDDEAPASC